MAELWYKTKEWSEYMNEVGTLLQEDDDRYETLYNLRLAAAEYHKGSLLFTKRNINSTELQRLQDNFVELKNQVDEWKENTD